MKNFRISKKFKPLLILLSLILILTSCAGQKKAEKKEKLRLVGLKGPTSLALADLTKSQDYDFELMKAPDEVMPKLLKGEADIGALPSNMAALLYAKSEGKVKVININTLGVLHIAAFGDDIKDISDLKGRKLISAGKGAGPEYILKHILKEAGLADNDITIEWKKSHDEVLAALDQDHTAAAMLPEPFVTLAEGKFEGLQRKLDLSKIWSDQAEKSGEKAALVMGVCVVRNDFLEKNPDLVKKFLKDAEESVKKVNAKEPELIKTIGELGIVPEKIADKVIGGSNLVSISGKEMKEKLEGYLTVLEKEDPKSVGGKLPADDFYYIAE